MLQTKGKYDMEVPTLGWIRSILRTIRQYADFYVRSTLHRVSSETRVLAERMAERGGTAPRLGAASFVLLDRMVQGSWGVTKALEITLLAASIAARSFLDWTPGRPAGDVA